MINSTPPKLQLDIQNVSIEQQIPNQKIITNWIQVAIKKHLSNVELCLRIVDEAEITELNNQWRGKNKATNVLSFPASLPEELQLPLLGDIIICAPIIKQEALLQNKTLNAHWAHIIIHGVLHLLGYDHIKESDANIMEALEINILNKLGYPNPYQ